MIVMNKYVEAEPITGRLSRPPDYTMFHGDHEKFGLT